MVSLIVVAIVVILIVVIIVEITHPPCARNESDQGWLLPKKTMSWSSSLRLKDVQTKRTHYPP